METSKEVFEEVFIRLDLFIRLIILDLMLIWLMVKYLFHLLVKCRKHQVVAKVRATEMALKLVAMSNVILNRYQHGLLVGMENTNNKITQIFYPCNSIEVKWYGFSKSCQRLSIIIGWITGLEDAPFGDVFPLKETLLELKLGGSECVIVSIRKMAADFVFEIEKHVDENILRS